MATPDYSGSTWYGAYSGNYTNASRPGSNPINKVVIHMTQGSWSSAMNWFRDSRAGVSAHYTVRSSDGFIGQSVQEQDIGYHAGNWSYNQTSVGIEHEGYVSNPDWFTEAMYRSSARLTAYLCKKYGIPIDRAHIFGHNEVPGATHTDPGGYWNWTKYMGYVKEYAGGATVGAEKEPLPNSKDTYSQVVGDLSVGRFTASSRWGSSSWSPQRYGNAYRHLDKPTIKRDPAKFKVKIPEAGNYEVYGWWSQDPSRNPRVTYAVKTADGTKKKIVDQRESGGKWMSLGTYAMAAGDDFFIRVMGRSTSKGKIIADAVGVVRR